jgi:DNA-binding MarR family transcriptional regulator
MATAVTDVPVASDASRRGLTAVAKEITAARFPDLDPDSIGLGMALIRAAHSHELRSETAVHRPRGQSWLSFRLLYLIWLLEPVTARDLARLVEVSRQTTSNTLRALEEDGLISRVRDRGDQRLVTIRLTPRGRSTAEESTRAQLVTEREWFAVLSRQERRQLAELLERLRRGIAAHGVDEA